MADAITACSPLAGMRSSGSEHARFRLRRERMHPSVQTRPAPVGRARIFCHHDALHGRRQYNHRDEARGAWHRDVCMLDATRLKAYGPHIPAHAISWRTWDSHLSVKLHQTVSSEYGQRPLIGAPSQTDCWLLFSFRELPTYRHILHATRRTQGQIPSRPSGLC